jgi:subtilase family serine protease
LVFSVAVTAKAEAKRQLVTGRIDAKVLTTLRGNTRPEANLQNDRGPVSADLQLDHLMLLLQRPPELEAQLTKFIDDLYNPSSPNFHKWLSAAQFGQQFGPAQSDVETVTRWLESEGFTVNVVYSNNMFIDFSGTARQVEATFHTEIHNYEVKGEAHIANSRDPQIPAALGQVVRGIVSLNDFKAKTMHELVHQAHVDAKTGELRTEYTHTGGSATGGVTPNYDNANGEELVPYDLEKIYNIAPLLTAGISGQGMKIVVVEDTNLYNCNSTGAAGAAGTPCSATSDWAVFRNTFGLGRYTAGSLTQSNPAPQTGANNCTNPGDNSDDVEAAIDVEWSTAAAPSASIVNASCSDPRTGFGGLTAIQNILTHPNADNVDVISMSYGESEEDSGATFNASFNTTFQQAAAAGIAVFVSAGDEDAASSDGGGADCTGFPASDNGDFGCAVHGITISGWMSSPYDVSVGGLDFADTYLGENSTYWLPANNVYYGSAKSYIPEQPWNDSCASTLLSNYTTGTPAAYGPSGLCNTAYGENFLLAVGGSGGPSACATGSPTVSGVAGGTCAGYAKPSYQSAYIGSMAGLQNDNVRDTPDVALMAANGLWGHYYAVCYSNPANNGNGGEPCTGQPVNWPGYGGTSVSSPIFAAIQALVIQHKGALQGLPLARYYQLAAAEYGPTGSAACNSTNATGAGSSSCIFHDVTLGDNDANCQSASVRSGKTTTTETFNCYLDGANVGVLSTSNSAYQPAYLTTTGWDFASGIGSVNAYNLVMSY